MWWPAPADIKGFTEGPQRPGSEGEQHRERHDIDISLRLAPGARIPEVSQAVQMGVKNAVQGMTGRVVNKVNVTIQDIDLSEETPKKKK